MFKQPNTPSPINVKNFGVGSCFVDCSGDVYLVIPNSLPNHVATLYLPEMTISKSKCVEDINYLSEDEARELWRLVPGNNAFSDMVLKPEGLKRFKLKYS